MKRFIYVCPQQPYIWFREWTKVHFCPQCGAGIHGKSKTGLPYETHLDVDLCLACGFEGKGFKNGTARIRRFYVGTRWKPWTWADYKMEDDIRCTE